MASQHLYMIVMLGLVRIFVVLSCQNLAVQHFMKIASVILARQKKLYLKMNLLQIVFINIENRFRTLGSWNFVLAL